MSANGTFFGILTMLIINYFNAFLISWWGYFVLMMINLLLQSLYSIGKLVFYVYIEQCDKFMRNIFLDVLIFSIKKVFHQKTKEKRWNKLNYDQCCALKYFYNAPPVYWRLNTLQTWSKLLLIEFNQKCS